MASKKFVSPRLQKIHSILQSIRDLVGDTECVQETALAMLESTRNEIVLRKNEIVGCKRPSQCLASESGGDIAKAGPSDETEAGEITVPRPKRRKWSQEHRAEKFELALELMKWILVFTRDSKGESAFTKKFLTKGFAGYKAFRHGITNIAIIVCKHLYPHDDDKSKAMLERFERKNGMLDHFPTNMKEMFWGIVKPRMPETEWIVLVNPAHEKHLFNLLLAWGKILSTCRDMGSVPSDVRQE